MTVQKIDYPNTGGPSKDDGESPVHPRVESGAVQFGDDWPGLFLRGDNAFNLATQIAQLETYVTNFQKLFEEMCRKAGETEEEIATRMNGVKVDCWFTMQEIASLRKNIATNVVVGGAGDVLSGDIYFKDEQGINNAEE